MQGKIMYMLTFRRQLAVLHQARVHASHASIATSAIITHSYLAAQQQPDTTCIRLSCSCVGAAPVSDGMGRTDARMHAFTPLLSYTFIGSRRHEGCDLYLIIPCYT